MCSDYGVDRQSSLAFHINQLRKALQPTLTTRTMLWLIKMARPFLNIDNEDYLNFPVKEEKEKGNGKGDEGDEGDEKLRALFQSLVAELKPSRDQIKKLIQLTDEVTSIEASENASEAPLSSSSSSTSAAAGLFVKLETISNDTDAKLNRLEELVSNKNSSLQSEVKEIQEIMSAKQIAKFVIWVDKNPACMQLLEALWPHLTS